jgi:hypothetical protein
MASQFLTFTAGSVLTSAQVNTYLMKQAVIVCDSTADYPASPVEGMTVYDKGADALKTYTTATTGFQPPWNMPWGVLSAVSTTTATTSIGSSLTLLTSLAITLTPTANRRLRISWLANMATADTAARAKAVSLTDGSGTQLQSWYMSVDANLNYTGQGVHYMTSTGSSMTWQVRASISANTCATNFASNAPGILIVEDIGPNGAPA